MILCRNTVHIKLKDLSDLNSQISFMWRHIWWRHKTGFLVMRSTHPKNEEFQTITSEKYNSESLNSLSSILYEILVTFPAYFKKEFGQVYGRFFALFFPSVLFLRRLFESWGEWKKEVRGERLQGGKRGREAFRLSPLPIVHRALIFIFNREKCEVTLPW